MATRGGFAAWTERAKDVIVENLRSYLSLNFANVLKEMPQIERYGLPGQTTAESFVNIFTALPHKEQRIPFVAVMSAPGVERKLGIGRQVIKTFHDPDTGLPTIREAVGGDLNVVIEIVAADTNSRSELTDIIFSFFTMYMEQTFFSFLGDTQTDPISGVPRLYQLILKSQATLGGETDQPRPEGEPFNRIYFNRITVPIIFLDYVDREGFDIEACYDSTLTPDDDQFAVKPRPLVEPGPFFFSVTDDFEDPSAPGVKWNVFTNNATVKRIAAPNPAIIRGTASVELQALVAGGLAHLVGKQTPTVSGRLRARFNDTDGTYALVLFAMMQGVNPLTDPCYHVIVKTGRLIRLEVRRGIIGDPNAVVVGAGSQLNIDTNLDLAAQFEWKIDQPLQRIRLRAYIATCESMEFGSLVKRLEVFDADSPFLTTVGEGFGFQPNPDATPGLGAVVVDDAEVLAELNVIVQSSPNIARVSP